MAINQNEYIHAMAEDPETGKPMQKVKVEGLESNSIQPTEIQSRYATTIQTHSGVTVAPSSSNPTASFYDAEGFDKLAITLTSSANATAVNKVYVNIVWSHDGVTPHGLDIYAAKLDAGVARGSGIVDTKARYFKLEVVNVETAPITVNTWSYLKA